jgi:hypothetical protein
MTEDWKAYLCRVNGKLASIFIDIGLRSAVPDPGKPWLLWVWIYFKQPRPDGLSSSEEFSTLCAIEDALTAAMKEKCRALLSGRITTDGRREFCYYGPTRQAFETTVAEAFSSFRGYDFDQGSQDDPQ